MSITAVSACSAPRSKEFMQTADQNIWQPVVPVILYGVDGRFMGGTRREAHPRP